MSNPKRKAIPKLAGDNPIQATAKDEQYWKEYLGPKKEGRMGTSAKKDAAGADGASRKGNKSAQKRKNHGSVRIKLGPAAMRFLSPAEAAELNEELMHPGRPLKSKKIRGGRDGKKGHDKRQDKLQREASAHNPRATPAYQTSSQELRPRIPFPNIKRLPPHGESPQLERPLTMPVHGPHGSQRIEKQYVRFTPSGLKELLKKLNDECPFKRGEAAITAGLVSKKRQREFLYASLKALLILPKKDEEEELRFQLSGAVETFGIWKWKDRRVVEDLKAVIAYAFLKEERLLFDSVLVAFRRIGTTKAKGIADEYEAKINRCKWSSAPATIAASDIK